MLLNLKAIHKDDTSTLSTLSIGNQYMCHVLEDVDRGLSSDMTLDIIKLIKIHGQTAIPSGTYEVVINWSNRFNTYLPLLLNVPGFQGVRIHAGNTVADTDGCLLVGHAVNNHSIVSDSRITLMTLMAILRKAERKEKIIINIDRQLEIRN